jgi:predicted O-methyltransferase YrrM
MVQPVPTLVRAATILLGALADGAAVFEFGSGGSTLFLAQRAARVVSVEHDAAWAAAVATGLEAHGLQADVRLVEAGQIAEAIAGEGAFNVVFVDCFGPQRERAIGQGARHVKAGGWLVADDYGNKPNVRRAVERLRGAGWDVAVVDGVKVHLRKGSLHTSTAFCRRGEGCS